MPVSILMPALSPTMEQGRLSTWHKSVGQTVSSGDLLMDVETDKAVMEVESTQEGILDLIVVPADTNDVKVGQVIGVLRSADEPEGSGQQWLDQNPCSVSGGAQAPALPQESSNKDACSPSSVLDTATVACDANAAQMSSSGRILVSPLAKKMANRQGIDLRHVTGSGPRGRIVKADIDGYVAKANSQASVSWGGDMHVPEPTRQALTPMRKAIAQRLTESKTTTPHFYLSVDCCMNALIDVRAKMNEHEKIFSINDFMVRACALALHAVPEMRVLWGGDHLMQHHTADIAVAVSIDGGLVTPIVSCAEQKSLRAISTEMKQWIAKARAGTLKPSDYQGGVFTLSNLGMMGVDCFYPIINPPHSGILAIGATKNVPVVCNGNVSVGQVMTASLAADHRAVDGAFGAAFLQHFKQLVEQPYALLS